MSPRARNLGPGPAQLDRRCGVIVDNEQAVRNAIRWARPSVLNVAQKAFARAVVDGGGFGAGWCFTDRLIMGWDMGCDERTVRRNAGPMEATGWLLIDIQYTPITQRKTNFYKVTPVPDDIATRAEIDGLIAARNARLDPTRSSKVPLLGKSSMSQPDKSSADPDPEESGSDLASWSHHHHARPRRRTVRVANQVVSWDGMRLPDPLPPGLHVTYTGVIDSILAYHLPAVDRRLVLNIATRCALHHMTPAQIGWAVHRTIEDHGRFASVLDLERVIQRGRALTASDAAIGRRLFIKARDAAAYDDGAGEPVESDHGVWQQLDDPEDK